MALGCIPYCQTGGRHRPNAAVRGAQTAATISSSITRLPDGTSGPCANLPASFEDRPALPFQLTTGPLSFDSLAPSPDGKKLFIAGRQARGELVRYDPQSRQFTPFLAGISAGEMEYSRDGQWVTYVSYPDHALWRSRAGRQLTPCNSPFPQSRPTFRAGRPMATRSHSWTQSWAGR